MPIGLLGVGLGIITIGLVSGLCAIEGGGFTLGSSTWSGTIGAWGG